MIRAALLALCMGALPAGATQDQWPALHDVTGVAADDVLNIRAAPDAGAEIVGTLEPDARDVEVIAPDPRHGWGQVTTAEGTGWVALPFLSRQPGQYVGAFLKPRRCFGTEPFWSLDLDEGTGAVFRGGPESETAAEGVVSGRFASLGRRDVQALRLTWRDGGDATAMLHITACSDGMSDRSYGIRIDLLRPGSGEAALLSGCCALSPAPQP